NTLSDAPSPNVTFNQAANNFHNTPGGADCAQPPLLFAPGGIEPAAVSAFRSGLAGAWSRRGGLYRGGVPLDPKKLAFIVKAAVQRWGAEGLSTDQIVVLEKMNFGVADLTDGYLASSGLDLIVFDRNAAGHGWFVDPTPLDDRKFGNLVSASLRYTDRFGAPAGHVDLLTAVLHEIGHSLGLPHA